jgi:hypothetical protein
MLVGQSQGWHISSLSLEKLAEHGGNPKTFLVGIGRVRQSLLSVK